MICTSTRGAKLAAVGLFVPAAVMGLVPAAQAASSAKPAKPTLAATPITTTTTVGMTTSASAALSGSFMTSGGTNGSITFTLFGPTNANNPKCISTGNNADLVYTSSAVNTNGDGVYGTGTGVYTLTATGTYAWVASYSGDVNNNAAASNCGDAVVTVGKASPTVVTTPASP
jgi:hypothetical protein